MKITKWHNMFAAVGETVDMDWNDLVLFLWNPIELREKTKAPAWSGATFTGARSKTTCQGGEVVALDYDNNSSSPTTIAQALEWWEGLRVIVHTTYSHTPERHKFRAVFQLSRVATADEYTQVVDWLISRAGAHVDGSTRDCSRLWFRPSVPIGGSALFEIHTREGATLDVDSVVGGSGGGGGGGGIANPERYFQAAITRAAEAFRAAPHGTRNRTVAREAYSIGGVLEQCGVSETQAEHALVGAMRAAQWHPYDEGHEVGTIRRQLAAGAANPREVRRGPPPGGADARAKLRSDAAARGAALPAEGSAAVDMGAVIQLPPRAAQRDPEVWHRELARAKSGKILENLANVSIILSHGPWAGAICYNLCENRIEIAGSPPGVRPGPRAWAAGDEQAVAIWLQREWNMSSVSPVRVFDAVTAIAANNQINPIRQWLLSLEWDGTPRVHRWLTRYAGVEENEYTLAVGSCWLRSVAARGLTPGYKVDSILVFEGNQGIKKSTFFKILGGDFFVSLTTIVGDRAVQNMMGKLLVELAELEALDRAEISALKGQITREVDRIRLPWGRTAVDVPRTAVLAGSCNRDDYLRDDTGNRRFWPVVATALDLDALTRDRDQLLAEAIVQVRRGELTYLPPQLAALAGAEADRRVASDAWEDRLEDWLKSIRDDSITISQVLDKLGVDLPKQGRPEQMRAASILRKNGWVAKQLMVNGERKKRWSYVG